MSATRKADPIGVYIGNYVKTAQAVEPIEVTSAEKHTKSITFRGGDSMGRLVTEVAYFNQDLIVNGKSYKGGQWPHQEQPLKLKPKTYH